MPNWEKPYDPYNHYNNKGDNFNRHGVTKITEKIMAHYFPYEACFYCSLGNEVPLKICYKTDVCKLRIKDKRNPTYVQTMGYHPGDDPTVCITLRSGQMAWLFYHNVPLIFRACNETGTVLHHKDGNPFNNHWSNMAVVDTHELIHGRLRRFKNIIESLNEESKLVKHNKNLKRNVEKLKKIYDDFHDVPDSPRVFMIIDIFDNYNKGNISRSKAEKALEKLDASLGKYIEGYDMRKIKYNNKHILEYERAREEVWNAI